jgi:hypothetical protein
MLILTCTSAETSFVQPRAHRNPQRMTNPSTLHILFFILTSLAAECRIAVIFPIKEHPLLTGKARVLP